MITSSFLDSREMGYLFIDAGCLREVLKEFAFRYLGVRDDALVTVNWLQLLSGSSHSKVFYYDAVPSRDYGEADDAWHSRIEPRMSQLRSIRAVSGYHVPLGDLRGKKARQKKVDVMIAVDMLTHTVRRNMHRCALLAGDVDFQPLIEALVREGMSVTLWHPAHASEDLTGAADSAEPIEPRLLDLLLTRDGLPLVSGAMHKRRPDGLGEALLEWPAGDEIARICPYQGGWMVERFNPLAYGQTLQLVGPRLSAVLASSIDRVGLTVPIEAWKLAQERG